MKITRSEFNAMLREAIGEELENLSEEELQVLSEGIWDTMKNVAGGVGSVMGSGAKVAGNAAGAVGQAVGNAASAVKNTYNQGVAASVAKQNAAAVKASVVQVSAAIQKAITAVNAAWKVPAVMQSQLAKSSLSASFNALSTAMKSITAAVTNGVTPVAPPPPPPSSSPASGGGAAPSPVTAESRKRFSNTPPGNQKRE